MENWILVKDHATTSPTLQDVCKRELRAGGVDTLNLVTATSDCAIKAINTKTGFMQVDAKRGTK